MKKESQWFLEWFNEDYLNLYAYRDNEEAKKHIHFLHTHLSLGDHDRILDLGCGSGRHSVTLGQFGYQVVGVDTSQFLIKEAIKKGVNLPNVSFFCRDMREIDELAPFDLVISMFTSFGYFESDEKNQEILNLVAQSLRPGGYFFMDFLNPPSVLKSLTPKETVIVKGEEVTVTREVRNDIIIKTIEFPGRVYCEKVKLYDPETIATMLIAAGFTILEQWGDYNGAQLQYSSERLLTLANVIA